MVNKINVYGQKGKWNIVSENKKYKYGMIILETVKTKQTALNIRTFYRSNPEEVKKAEKKYKKLN